MNRNCPVCNSANRDVFHIQQFTDGTEQKVAFCLKCGMPYACESPEANYDRESKYAVPDGCGSGENKMDRRRLEQTAIILAEIPLPMNASILDIGCARGGMLEALLDVGFTDVMGMDPSDECVEACTRKGLNAFRGTLEALPAINEQFDCIILSHVLEHIWNVPRALQGIRGRLKTGGYFYIEVPDASRYLEYLNIPFLDFNREHVNHFDIQRLRHALCNSGLNNGNATFGAREIEFPCGKYPVIYAIGKNEPYNLQTRLTEYVTKSTMMMDEIEQKLYGIPVGGGVVIWGYGELFQRLKSAGVLDRYIIAQIIDRDPAKRKMADAPEHILPELPIIVTSIVNKESILRDIYNNLRNADRMVITL